jgi:hypothetical protein
MPKHSFDTCSDLLYGYYLDGSAEAKQALTNVIDDLLYYFGNESSIRLYRGLSFRAAKQRIAFITSLGDQLMLDEQYVSSWSTSSNIAQYFAKRKKYGIVISFIVPKRVAADLRVLKFNNELEYILPPGSYKLDKFTLIG